MSNNAGTLETVALELSRIVQPLQDDLKPGRARVVLDQLGVHLSPAQETSIAVPLNTTANKVPELVTKTGQLIAAIGNNNVGDIVSKGGEIISITQSLIASFEGIKNGLNGIGIPNANEIPGKLLNYLLYKYFDRVPGFTAILEFLDIIQSTVHNAGSTDPNNPTFTTHSFHLDRIGTWLSNGGQQFKTLYGWGDPSFNGKQLFAKTEKILADLGLPVIYDETAADAKLDIVLIEATPKNDVNPKGLFFKVKSAINSGPQVFEQNDWKIESQADVTLPANAGVLIQPNGNVSVQSSNGSGTIQGNLLVKWTGKRKAAPEPFLILGQAGGSRFEVMEFSVLTDTSLTWDAVASKANGKFRMEGSVKGCKVIIDAGSGDGFLKNILPSSKVEASFDLVLGVSSETGFYIGGSSALEFTLPLHIELGPVSINNLAIGLKFKDGKISTSLATDLGATLGPIVTVIQNMGVTATLSFPPDNGGNLGPVNLQIGFKPPNGVGLSIDTGIVKGGGFLRLEPEKGEYSGALELSIKNTIQVAAIGIINTKMPDGTEGFSMLIILSVQFTPGIVLGMGFFLNGLGGMLGINRTISVPALREGVRNNALDSILFPEDVVANINTLLPQIKQIFPIQRDQFFIGLMAKITWGVPTLISIEFGIAIEFTCPVRIAILGVLKIVLPTEDAAILRLQVNFLGIIDFDNGYISFDASIVNSRILTFTLEGDMALRLNWGRTKGFLMSVGGFHPSFTPPSELNVPSLRRLTLTIFSGNPNLVLTCYFAVTSNTVQFGARIDLRFEVGSFSVVGYLLFDVLFQFSPFHFEAHIGAGLAVKCGSSTLFSIDLDFVLSGPAPWNAKGTASFSILFITVKVRFNITWGDAQQISEPSIAVLPLALEAFSLPANWVAEIPVNRTNLVSLKELKSAAGEIILQSYGALKVSQTVVPLNMDINKFGNNIPLDIKQFRINKFTINNQLLNVQDVRDAFAPASFLKMEDEDKLKSPSYAQEVSGVTGADSDLLNAVYGTNRQLAYDCSISDSDPFPKKLPDFVPFNMGIFKLLVRGGDIGKSSLSKENKSKSFRKEAGAVSIGEESFVIVNNSTLTKHAAAAFSGGSQAEAQTVLNNILRTNPELRNSISITPAYHLETP